MKQSLRDFLRTRCGLSESELDKLESGDRPDDGKILRKGEPGGDADDSGRFHPGFTTMRKCVELMDQIQESLTRIERGDRERAAFARGVAMMNGAGHNGLAGIET
jgi:hypothetical protein